jgi:hypothetical protein
LEFRLGLKDLVIEVLQLFHILFLLLGALRLQISDIAIDFLDIVVAFLSGLLGLVYLVQDLLVLPLDVLLNILYLTEFALNFFLHLFLLAL